MKPVPELLKIENDLYGAFQHCGVQLYDPRVEEEEWDWDWDWYFLMQHHGAPTRVLDWTDGALIALHFALRGKPKGEPDPAFVYVLEPDPLKDQLNALPETALAIEAWRTTCPKVRENEVCRSSSTLGLVIAPFGENLRRAW